MDVLAIFLLGYLLQHVLGLVQKDINRLPKHIHSKQQIVIFSL